MNRKQLINAVIILVILAVISFFTLKKNLSSWQRGNDIKKSKLVENFDVNKVAKLAILTNSESLELHKKSDGKWAVAERSDYPLNFTKLSNFLLTLAEIDIIQTPRITKSQLASFKLIMPEKGKKNKNAGTLLSIYDKNGNTMLSLLIGEQHFPANENANPFEVARADGCYILKTGSEQVALINNPLATIKANPQKWINTTFFQIPDILSLSLADKENKNLWTITRRQGVNQPWQLVGLKVGDKPLVRPMMEATLTFAKITFDDVLPLGNRDFKNAKRVTIKTQRGLVYKIDIIQEGRKFIAKCAISADLQRPAIKKNETPEEASKREQVFAKKEELLDKQLETLKFYSNWAFEFPKYKIEKILKTKSQLYRPAKL